MTNTAEFPVPGVHVKGTKVSTLRAGTGTVVRYERDGFDTLAVICLDSAPTKEHWFLAATLTVIAE